MFGFVFSWVSKLALRFHCPLMLNSKYNTSCGGHYLMLDVVSHAVLLVCSCI